jgi:uncharacterized protein
LSDNKKKNFEVKCVNCQEKFLYYDSEFRPFCSERCKLVDLGQWFQGGYSIATKEPLNEEDINVIEKALIEKLEGEGDE